MDAKRPLHKSKLNRFSEFSDSKAPFVEMNYALIQLLQAESTLFIQVGSKFSYISDTQSSYFI